MLRKNFLRGNFTVATDFFLCNYHLLFPFHKGILRNNHLGYNTVEQSRLRRGGRWGWCSTSLVGSQWRTEEQEAWPALYTHSPPVHTSPPGTMLPTHTSKAHISKEYFWNSQILRSCFGVYHSGFGRWGKAEWWQWVTAEERTAAAQLARGGLRARGFGGSLTPGKSQLHICL